ncbi:MAG: methyltransferase domain-containing protein [Winogradskyella sp.]|nr:methyltransferase domain-containing protein [Winogradskyella sp.]MBT8375426.1 methyltransferase domain-containing protein [Bacteroidia bacterium]NNC45918.1 methyltransferase domain-containing protein [Winogradskyella sp.]NNF85759.1 methyltransferase domain-containing protein [Winogradskyella sp.]NNK39800.1 methyltransferase domain-containing protein [Winogradskyella sp.]
MTQIDPRAILKHPLIYTTYQKLVGGYKARQLFVENILEVKAGQKILDIGCGPGDILDFLPEVDYTGIDIDAQYINKAKEKYGEHGEFICTTVEQYQLTSPLSFDLVIAAGVLHHVDDTQATVLLKLAKAAKKPHGRFVSMDGCFIPQQNKISKYLIQKDRGEYVRTSDAYKKLAEPIFDNVKATIEESFFNIPYTLLILDCQ